jgi:hypothetical protein
MNALEVVDGETTEILLISQCRADQTSGGLDVIATINHPPVITGITYDPSKFICESETTICVTVVDPDGDPVEVYLIDTDFWSVVAYEVVAGAGETTACFTIAFPGPGDYSVGFVAYDMGYGPDGDLLPMEALLALQGDPAPSRDEIIVPVHVLDDEDCIESCLCPEGFTLTPAGDECIRTTEVPATEAGTLYTVCPAAPSSAYGWAGVIFPGGLIDNLTAFFLERLNTIGVWACDSDSSTAGTTPVGEWIGFSACIDIDVPGDYVIGMAADNRMRFRLNGTPFFTMDSYNTLNFNHWWMNPVSLGSGLNIIELEGYNDGLIASFGADIYGPYPAGSLDDDASMAGLDYEGNVEWSTLDVIGQPFITGEVSGLSCPDGYSLNTCTGELTCTLIERVPCE